MLQTLIRILSGSGMTLLLCACQWLPSSDDWAMPWQQEDSAPASPAYISPHAAQVQQLIARGNLAFTKDQLSVPASDNALLHYRAALALEPDNALAQDGIKKVTKRFRKLARIAHDNGDKKQARKYLREAETISGIDNPANRKLRHDLEESTAGQDQRALDHNLKTQLRERQQQLQDRAAGDRDP